jgi:hypothetical protein
MVKPRERGKFSNPIFIVYGAMEYFTIRVGINNIMEVLKSVV